MARQKHVNALHSLMHPYCFVEDCLCLTGTAYSTIIDSPTASEETKQRAVDMMNDHCEAQGRITRGRTHYIVLNGQLATDQEYDRIVYGKYRKDPPGSQR